MARPAQNQIERFMAKVTKNRDCWLWTAQVKRDGYGRFRLLHGPCAQAHRVSYAMFVGEIPIGQCVLHKCDVRICVNPEHLFLGTKADNIRDMDSKGRRGTRRQRNLLVHATNQEI